MRSALILSLLFLGLAICHPIPSKAGETSSLGRAAVCSEIGPCRYLAPAVRIAVVLGIGHGQRLLIPNNGYDFHDSHSKRLQRGSTWSEPPFVNPDNSLLESDNNAWQRNVVLHGAMGSELYLSARDFGHSPLVSFGYAALASTVWEYPVAGAYRQPSAVDLFLTPFAGVLIGELRYQLLRATAKIDDRFVRGLMAWMIDPLGEIERRLWGCRRFA